MPRPLSSLRRRPLLLARSLLAGILCLLFLTPCRASAQVSEAQAKAAFVFNVIRYVTWPTSAVNDNAIQIGILGKSPADNAWDRLQGKVHQGRKLVVRKSRNLDDLLNSQIIFIEASERNELGRIHRLLKNEPILTISDMDNFTRNDGGMIQLRFVNSRLTLTVHLGNARASGLDISSYLLKLAVEVQQ
jgi:hypothetical protein